MNCVVCLSESEDVLGVFNEEGKNLEIAAILKKHLNFIEEQLKFEDSSAKVCLICWHNVYTFNAFYSRVSTKHEKPVNLLEDLEASLKQEKEEQPKRRSTRSRKKVEPIKTEPLDEVNVKIENQHEDLNLENSELTPSLPDDSKEFLDSFFMDHDNDTAFDESFDDSLPLSKPKKTSKKIKSSKTSKKRNSSLLKENDTDESSNDSLPLSKSVKKLKKTKITSKDKEPNSNPESEEKKKKAQEEEDLIKEYCKMICDLCPYEFKNYNDVKSHFRQKHTGIKGYLTCCDRKFKKRLFIVDHIMSHKNPNHFQCPVCKNIYKHRHSLSIHMTLHEATVYKCTHPGCDRGFAKRYKLTNHIKTSHIPKEDLIHPCDLCDKRFNSVARLNYHHNQMHVEENRAFICDLCGKTLKSKSNLAFHRKTHQETEENIQRIQCSICSHWLKASGIRKHMYRHEQEKEEHICTHCGKRSVNRDALKSHIRYVHLTERTHACNLCDKAFKRATALKEHMASHGTEQILYECSICQKTFNSNANMHSHRKKTHPKEWEESLMPKYLKP